MTKEQILNEQIEALEKLLQLKSAVIDEQERQIQRLQGELAVEQARNVPNWQPHVWTPAVQPWAGPLGVSGSGVLTIPNPTCSDGKSHEYPSMWGGVLPAPCSKCGQQQGYSGTITSSGGSNIGTVSGSTIDMSGQGPLTTVTSGYIAPADNNILKLAK